MRIIVAKALSFSVAACCLLSALPAFAATKTVSGVVTDSFSNPVVGAEIDAHINESYESTYTDSSGAYSFQVQEGDVFSLIPAATTDGVHLPDTFWFNYESFVVTDDAVFDLPLPIVKVDVHVEDAGEADVAGAIVATLGNEMDCSMVIGGHAACGYSGSQGTTDASGDVTLWLFQRPAEMPYQLQIIPTFASNLAPKVISVAATGDASEQAELDDAVTLSGTVVDGQSDPIEDMFVYAQVGTVLLMGTTNASGEYAIHVADGSDVSVMLSQGQQSGALPSSLWFLSDPFTVNGDTDFDFGVPVVQVTVHVQDPSENPVSGAYVETYNTESACNLEMGSQSGCGLSQSWDTTDANGDAVLWLFARPLGMPYQMRVAAPGASGLQDADVELPALTGGTFVVDLLQN